jgi:hypothetical protein
MTTTNDRPDLSSEAAPDIGKTVNVKPKLMSGHETQMGLESRTYWPTDHRSWRDFDFDHDYKLVLSRQLVSAVCKLQGGEECNQLATT